MKSIKKLMKEYNLTKEELFNLMHKCLRYYLSEWELYQFILEYYMREEMRINKRFVK
jgi:hypothetical protein